MLSEPYGSHYIRLRYQTASRRRRTIIFSHSFFWTAPNSSDMLSAESSVRLSFCFFYA